jgi:hypothetical protein
MLTKAGYSAIMLLVSIVKLTLKTLRLANKLSVTRILVPAVIIGSMFYRIKHFHLQFSKVTIWLIIGAFLILLFVKARFSAFARICGPLSKGSEPAATVRSSNLEQSLSYQLALFFVLYVLPQIYLSVQSLWLLVLGIAIIPLIAVICAPLRPTKLKT